MKNLYVIDRIFDDYVKIENIETKKSFDILKTQIEGECIESNVLVKINDKYVYSEVETNIRTNFIENLSKGLWN